MRWYRTIALVDLRSSILHVYIGSVLIRLVLLLFTAFYRVCDNAPRKLVLLNDVILSFGKVTDVDLLSRVRFKVCFMHFESFLLYFGSSIESFYWNLPAEWWSGKRVLCFSLSCMDFCWHIAVTLQRLERWVPLLETTTPILDLFYSIFTSEWKAQHNLTVSRIASRFKLRVLYSTPCSEQTFLTTKSGLLKNIYP